MSQTEPLSSNAVISSGGRSSSFASASSYAGSQSVGASSSASATSSSGKTSSSQRSVSDSGATSASASASAVATGTEADTSANASVVSADQNESAQPADSSDSSDSEEEPATGELADIGPETSQAISPTISTLWLGTLASDLLDSTAQQDIFWGNGGADVFQLGATGAVDLNQADIILDYNPEEGDLLTLSNDLTLEDIAFEVIDFNGDGSADSTVIRSLLDNTILTVTLNTVDELGHTRLSLADFADAETVAALSVSASDKDEPNAGTTSSASSSSFVDGKGAGSSSSATATSPTGETSTSSKTVYTPGASSSSGSASASSSPEGSTSSASAEAPATELSPAPALDFLLGTAENDTLVGNDNQNIFIGNQGADLFVLTAASHGTAELADVIVDFSKQDGDLIKLSAVTALSTVTFSPVDIDGNGTLDATSIKSFDSGAIYAVVLNSLDTFGATLLSANELV